MHWKRFYYNYNGEIYDLSYVKNYSRVNRKWRQIYRKRDKEKYKEDIPTKFRAVMYERTFRVVLLRKHYKTKELIAKTKELFKE